MKRAVLLGLVFLLAACSSPSALPAANSPTAGAPFLLKSGGPTVTPEATAPLAQPTPANTIAPQPTAASLNTAAPVPAAPILSKQFALRELPGEGRSPYSLAALGDKLYITDAATDNIAVVQNDRVVKFIPTGPHPGVLAADTKNARLYVALEGDKAVGMMVNDTITLRQDVGDEARALLLMDNRLFVGLQDTGSVLVLDPITLKPQGSIAIPGAFGIINLAGDPVHHKVYADFYEKIAVIDSNALTFVNKLDTKGSYYTLLAQPSSDRILTNRYDDKTRSQSLISLDPTTGETRGSAPIGGDPAGAVLNADGSRAYVANSFSNNVSVIDPRGPTLVATVSVDLRPIALWLDENAHKLYVANADSDNLSIINTDTNQVTATIPLAMLPTALAANDGRGRVYVANASTDSVYVIEGTSIVKEIGVGRHPIDLARDESSQRIFIANAADGTLSVLDESDLSIRSTLPITPVLTTVAVDAQRNRLFAGDMILDLRTLAPVGRLTMQGATVGSVITPNFIRVNPNNNRIYALGWNGTPGSNSRTVTYSIDAGTLQQRTTLAYNGNTTALASDPDTNRVFLAGTHPLAFTNELSVFDANDTKLLSLALPARTMGMAYNPQTRHLFLSYTTSNTRPTDPTPSPADRMVQVFDTNSFGEVGRLTIESPGKMTRLGNTIYVASRKGGTISVIQDTATAIPPSPTPTWTPSPYATPTLAPTMTLTRGPAGIAARSTPGMVGSPTKASAIPTRPLENLNTPSCSVPVSPLLAEQWTPQVAGRIGCPLESQRLTSVAAEVFERGTMYWREDEKRIYVLYGAGTWAVYDDRWTDKMPENSCPNVTVAAGKIKPKRGFGKLWCDQSDVQAKIGAATGDEAGGYNAAAQKFERGLMLSTTGGALLLYGDGKWE